MTYLSAATLVSRMTPKVVREICTTLPEPGDAAATDADVVAAALHVDAGTTPPEGYVAILAAAIEQAIRWSESRVESECGKRFAVPLLRLDGSIPDEIEEATYSLARYSVYSRRDYRIPDSVMIDRDDTTSWLKRVGKGDAILDLAAAGQSQAPASIFSSGVADTSLMQTQYMP